MTYTDTRLKQALAKMLPDILTIITKSIWWSNNTPERPYPTLKPVSDTELMHLCHLVEDDFNSKQQDDYGKELYKLIPYGKMLFSATWQQRVTALAKVKGIEMA